MDAEEAFDKIIKILKCNNFMKETTIVMGVIIAPATEGCCEDLMN